MNRGIDQVRQLRHHVCLFIFDNLPRIFSYPYHALCDMPNGVLMLIGC